MKRINKLQECMDKMVDDIQLYFYWELEPQLKDYYKEQLFNDVSNYYIIIQGKNNENEYNKTNI